MRTLYIVLRFLPFALSFRRDFRRWVLWGEPVRRTGEFHERRATRLAATVAGLGPSFVKLAQVFAARADLIPEPYLGALGTLLDRVPPAPWAAVEAELRRSYDRDPDEIFDGLEREPLAAGSLGQVYRARLGGEDVVVKVLRPGVEHVVERDLAAALRIARVVERHWPNPHVRGFRSAVEEFQRRVGDEMDFRLEAEHAREIGESLAGDPRVIVPRIHHELTRQRAMVMEYVEGTRVDHAAPLLAAGRIPPHTVVRTVMELYIQMMLMDGLFHADPHPGNLLVREDGRVVLLDFGMCVRVPAEMRARLVRTVMAAIRKDAHAVADGFHALGIVSDGADPAEIRRLTQLLLDLAYSGAAPQEAARVLAEEVVRTLYDWPIVLTGEMVYFARAAALIEGLGTRFVPGFNSITFATPVVLRHRRAILATLQIGDGRPATPDDWARALGELVGDATRIVVGAGRELAAVVGTGLADLLAGTRIPALDPPRMPTGLPSGIPPRELTGAS